MDIEKILVIDDELIIRRTLEEYCHRARIKVKSVACVEDALHALESGEGFDLIFLDINLPDGDGPEVLEEIAEMPNAPLTIMITGQGTIESAVQCMKLGAYDYLLKPFSTDQLDMVIQRATRYTRLVQVNRELVNESSSSGEPILGDSSSLNHLKSMIQRVARTDATVLISGETGTGKELVAQSIHQNSLRRDKPFIKVNCAAVSETLIESEFFGHEKGAFTGAQQKRIGRFELADGGTLLLDEISEVSLGLQAKLLRILQENELERVGGTKTIKVDVRILATTNRDLYQTVLEGKFREDLYYRLNVFPVESPPLRERAGDVLLLALEFLKKFARKHGCNAKDFTKKAYEHLEAHTWPGNVRELQNVVERAVILTGDKEYVDASTLPLELQVGRNYDAPELEGSARPAAIAAASPAAIAAAAPAASGEQTPELPVARGTNAPTVAQAVFELGDDTQDWTLESMERKLIFETLRKTDGNRTKAAEMMQVSIRTLFNKLSQYKKSGFSEFEPYFN
jgi:two-component system response regulator AtoC